MVLASRKEALPEEGGLRMRKVGSEEPGPNPLLLPMIARTDAKRRHFTVGGS
jgi:hypothetical protein